MRYPSLPIRIPAPWRLAVLCLAAAAAFAQAPAPLREENSARFHDLLRHTFQATGAIIEDLHAETHLRQDLAA